MATKNKLTSIQKIFQDGINKSKKLDDIILNNFKDMLRNAPYHQVELLEQAIEEIRKEKNNKS